MAETVLLEGGGRVDLIKINAKQSRLKNKKLYSQVWVILIWDRSVFIP